MLALGTEAANFSLKDMVSGDIIKLKTAAQYSKATLIFFICNHCPYVLHIIEKLSEVLGSYQQSQITILAINSNDPNQYPEDSPEKMKQFAEQHGFSFPYLFDETQEVASTYHAACTPDFFLYNQNLELIYRGQFDDSRPGNTIPVTGADLKNAIDCVLNNLPNEAPQKPSLGCNIKWST